jgi:hypothetical protein
VFFFAVIAAANADFPETRRDLPESAAVIWADAAYFTLVSAGIAQPELDADGAFEYVRRQGWAAQKKTADDVLRLDEAARLFSLAFQIHASFFGLFFPQPRFAFHAFQKIGLIDSGSDPAAIVSGKEFFELLSAVHSRAPRRARVNGL